MSKFTNYDVVSQNYDQRRVAYGADVLLEEITRKTQKSPKDLYILDAGCGTGNYSLALLQLGVGKMNLLDASAGMLKHAEVKLQHHIDEGRVDGLTQDVLPSLPYNDRTFDAVMFTCVMHHLDSDGNSNFPDGPKFPKVAEAIMEASRVLKPGGLFATITTYPDQANGVWFAHLYPPKLDSFLRKFPDFREFVSMTTAAGLTSPEEKRLFGSDWFRNYKNPDGPETKAWRDSDSYWSLLESEEIEHALENLREMKLSGRLESFVNEKDGSNDKGHFAIVTARKPL